MAVFIPPHNLFLRHAYMPATKVDAGIRQTEEENHITRERERCGGGRKELEE